MNEDVQQSIEVTDQRNLFRHFHRMYLKLFMEDIFQAGIGKRVIQNARFYFGKIKYISNQMKEQIAILIDYFDKFFFFFFIGSATGVTVMGLEKIDFMYYTKRFSILALIGYCCGAGVYMLLFA